MEKLKVNIQKKPPGSDGLVSCKNTKVRHSLYKRLFGTAENIAIIVPGKDVASVEIVTVPQVELRGGACHAK